MNHISSENIKKKKQIEHASAKSFPQVHGSYYPAKWGEKENNVQQYI